MFWLYKHQFALLYFIGFWYCPHYLLLLRSAFLLWYGVVHRLQSAGATQNKAFGNKWENGNTRRRIGVWDWRKGRKRTNLYHSGCVQSHAETAEWLCFASPANSRV